MAETVETHQSNISFHAEKIWTSLQYFINPQTHLPVDMVNTHNLEDSIPITSPTNIGLHLLNITAARELRLINPLVAHHYAKKLSQTLINLDYPNQLPVNWYDTTTAKPIQQWPVSLQPYHVSHSSVDTAWFITGLYGASQAFPDITEFHTLQESIHLGKFYNPTSHLCIGELSLDGSPANWDYGALSEARIISYMGVALDQIPPEHLNYLWHNAKNIQQQLSPNWLAEHPNTVPTWRGNIFEKAMPLLIFDESELCPNLWPVTHQDFITSQQHVAEPKTGLWGFSPCSSPTKDNQYVEYGIPELGLYSQGASLGIKDNLNIQPVITPHALYLSLLMHPHAALQAIFQLTQVFPESWNDYGFPDSINTITGATSQQLLILDQSMAFLSLAEHIKPGCIRKYFNPLQKKLIPHLSLWNSDNL